jgi:hypothetical protein
VEKLGKRLPLRGEIRGRRIKNLLAGFFTSSKDLPGPTQICSIVPLSFSRPPGENPIWLAMLLVAAIFADS